MSNIVKIIHQIWSDKYNQLPPSLYTLSQTWIKKHPDWEYIYWNDKKMNDFVYMEYPEYSTMFNALPFDMQRWDAIRFLILKKMGGMHVDFDYECVENIEPLIRYSDISIALEPNTNAMDYGVNFFLNSALLYSKPNNFFLDIVINQIFSEDTFIYDQRNKPRCVLNTTGPLIISRLYENLSSSEKKRINLIPAKYVTPFDSRQIKLVWEGVENEELELCIRDAYAIHYYTTMWVKTLC